MADLILGPMLRFVSETAATVWFETDRPCTVELLGHRAATFCVAGHFYALVIIEGLEPGTSHPYEVKVDGETRWPRADSTLPPSCIRTLPSGPVRFVFGSCRTAAPHEPPWSLQFELDSKGRGVDALRTYALRMLELPQEEWPELAIFLGDQIYADDSSPVARERIAARRQQLEQEGVDKAVLPPPELVGGFEEYTWLYHESWTPEVERWFFANVPSVMIFDDHDMIDDWNISDTWMRQIREKPWWDDHLLGGLMSYWLYQHLGNLDPQGIRAEGMLDRLSSVPDGAEVLGEWARQAHIDAIPEGDAHHRYRFSFHRDIGRVRLVMVDNRTSRNLHPGQRRMVDASEWKWVVDACRGDVDHLLIGTSLPVFVPTALHDAQVWSEAVCDGAWGKLGRSVGEWLRQKADMEDWASFVHSFDDFVELIGALADPPSGSCPATISVLSGDIHFSYATEIRFQHGRSSPDRQLTSRVHQLVSSPIRNALRPPESTAMRIGASRFARFIGRALRRAVHRPASTLSWDIDLGPVFANSLAELTFDGRAGRLLVLQAQTHKDDETPRFDEAFSLDLVAGSLSTALGGDGARTSSGRTRRRRRSRWRPPRRR
jgi:hypothetical protein